MKINTELHVAALVVLAALCGNFAAKDFAGYLVLVFVAGFLIILSMLPEDEDEKVPGRNVPTKGHVCPCNSSNGGSTGDPVIPSLDDE